MTITSPENAIANARRARARHELGSLDNVGNVALLWRQPTSARWHAP